MTIAYSTSPADRRQVLLAWTGTPSRAVLTNRTYWYWLILFALFTIFAYFVLPAEEANDLREPIGYASGLLGSLFIFQITSYNNTAFQRYQTHWESAMKGWIRINDVAHQAYAHLHYDPWLAGEVMRLMHAANHLLYMDMAGQNDLYGKKQAAREQDEILIRRGLITHEEFVFLQSEIAAGVNPGFQCAAWALKLCNIECLAGRLPAPLAKALDQSIMAWREHTNFILNLEMNPIPFAYYYLLCLELDLFQFSLAVYMCAARGGWREVARGGAAR